MFLTGFADEAGRDWKSQLEATLELGWDHIDLRLVGNAFFALIPEADFERISQDLEEHRIIANCYGSGIANGETPVLLEASYEKALKELLAAIPRMKKLHIPMIRGMSFQRAKETPDSPEVRQFVFDRVNRLVDICADNGIVYAHENCYNYGGMSHEHTLRLLENIRHKEAFTLIFDTGNPPGALDRRGELPYKRQSAWEFYRQVRDFVSYVHIKDGTAFVKPDGTVNTPDYCFPGDGEGDVRAIVLDLLRRGYDGGFCMEPHLIFPPKPEVPEKERQEILARRYRTYIRYGKRFEELLESCREQLKDGKREGI